MQLIRAGQEGKQTQMMKEVKSKPKISRMSQILTNKRSKTPVFQRLQDVKIGALEEQPFVPGTNPKSPALLNSTLTVYESLYTPRTKKTFEKAATQKKLPLTGNSPYRINTSIGAVSNDFQVNEINYTPTLEFILHSLNND